MLNPAAPDIPPESEDQPSSESIKESRRVLRLVQAHLAQAHQNLGVQTEAFGLVDVMHHSGNSSAQLNYVAPRKKTAWVPAPEVKRGLDRLRELKRTPRVYYIEGLFPPVFARSLLNLGLMVEREHPIVTFKLSAEEKAPAYKLGDAMSIVKPTTADGIALWWYVWRNANFDVVTSGTDPVYIGRDLQEMAFGNQVDLVLYRYGFPIGVARLSIYGQTAHISAAALMHEHRSRENITLLYKLALKTAEDQGCQLVFTTGTSEQDRIVCREIGFLDSGSIVVYAESIERDEPPTNIDDNRVEEPVFVLR